jgi:hypothetical protein
MEVEQAGGVWYCFGMKIHHDNPFGHFAIGTALLILVCSCCGELWHALAWSFRMFSHLRGAVAGRKVYAPEVGGRASSIKFDKPSRSDMIHTHN